MTFHVKTAPFYTWCAVLVAASVLVALAVSGGLSDLLTGGWGILWMAYTVWYVLGRSRLVVGADELTIYNPFVTHTVNYAALIDVSTKYHLTLVTPTKRFQAFGLPSSGMVASLSTHRQDLERLPAITYGAERSIRASDLPNSAAGAVALVVRGYWQELVEDAALEGVSPRQESRVDAVGAAIFVLLLLAAVAGLAF
ncbi:hypothetical protein QM007_10025 [Rothia sp. SD9660Na]|uniref:hypothetical protein n=1 Tax=Rothia sp. SD9660Na TaxID=3047030 RepID=UPI0024B9EF61|nr:hypothetical protein [Rothia sp. SD9660Na]WHS50237.1 hypothetical protein QM007_10025 [Rothia sp. SD9660Na]